MKNFEKIETDLVIIGAGMAGMVAAVFAANRDINSVLLGGAGSFDFSSGLLDLWGADLKNKDQYCKKPLEAVSNLKTFWPHHPYTRIKKEVIDKVLFTDESKFKKT